MFWVGSGGLARELASLPDLFDTPPREALVHEKQEGAILILVGSLSAVSERQCAMLRERGTRERTDRAASGLASWADEHADWRAWQSKIGDFLERHLDLLVRIGRDDAFDPAEGAHLSTALAALVTPHFRHVGGLIATGGETARAMLSAAGIGSLDLLAEVEAGVAVARPCAPHAARPAIVTKAGAFGSEHALFGAWEHLQRLPLLPTLRTTGRGHQHALTPMSANTAFTTPQSAPLTRSSTNHHEQHSPRNRHHDGRCLRRRSRDRRQEPHAQSGLRAVPSARDRRRTPPRASQRDRARHRENPPHQGCDGGEV